MTEGEQELWDNWGRRWRTFQETYIPDRQRLLEVLCEYVALRFLDRPVRALDLCCGPGSFGVQLLELLPGSRIVAADIDPWIIDLGRRTNPTPQIEWTEVDIRVAGWVDRLPQGPFDVVALITALSWFDEPEIARIYSEAVTLLGSNGVIAVSDVMPAGSGEIEALSAAALRTWQSKQLEKGGASWQEFWADAAAVPEFQALLIERHRRLGFRRPQVLSSVHFHLDALRATDLQHVGEVWRCHEFAAIIGLR